MPAPVGRGAAFGAPEHRRGDHARAGGCGRAHHAVELSHRDSRLEDRARIGFRQLRGAQARRPRAGLRVGVGRDHQPLGHSGGRVQPRDGARQRDRRCAGEPPRHPCDQLHGLGGRGSQHRHPVRHQPQEGAARNGRQEPAGGARRRRPRAGRGAQRAERVLLDRPALHGVEPPHRDRRHLPEVHRGDEGAHGEDQGRRRARAGHRCGAGLVEVAARPGHGIRRHRQGRGRHAGGRR
ncbi:hypothetical protein FQZ97_840500 [compost metagenome]